MVSIHMNPMLAVAGVWTCSALATRAHTQAGLAHEPAADVKIWSAMSMNEPPNRKQANND